MKKFFRSVIDIEFQSREYGDLHGENSLFSHSLAHMYYEDWHNGIVPFSSRRNEAFRVEVTPADREDWLSALFRGRDYRGDSLADGLVRFLEEAVQLLIIDSIVVFEIHNGEAEGQFVLHATDAVSLSIDGDKVLRKTKHPATGEIQIVEMERNRLFIVEEPSWIEDGNGFALTVRNLIRESRRESAPVELLRRSSEGQSSFFDYAVFKRMQERRVLSLTRNSGWAGRSLYDRELTEYYSIFRYLKFYFHGLKLRDYMMDKVNERLLPQLRTLGSNVNSISIRGLPVPTDVLEIMARLEVGDIGFKEALDRAKSLEY